MSPVQLEAHGAKARPQGLGREPRGHVGGSLFNDRATLICVCMYVYTYIYIYIIHD